MRECFVIMPIGSGDAYRLYRNRYENIIQPAVEGLRIDGRQVFRCVRADFVAKTGSITRDLLGRLYRSDAVVADLTDLDPNVFYELGVRHALRSGTILIALKGTTPPFDVGDLRVILYEDRVGGEKEAIPQIQDMLRSLLGEECRQDSPVLDAIPELAGLGTAEEHSVDIAALLRERDLLRAQLEISREAGLTSRSTLERMRRAVEEIGKRLTERERREAQVVIESLVQSRQVALPVGLHGLSDVTIDPGPIFGPGLFSQDSRFVHDLIQRAPGKSGLRGLKADSILGLDPIIGRAEGYTRSGRVVV